MSSKSNTAERELRRRRAAAQFQSMMTARVGSLANRSECKAAVEDLVDRYVALADTYQDFDGTRECAHKIAAAALRYINSLDALDRVGATFTAELHTDAGKQRE